MTEKPSYTSNSKSSNEVGRAAGLAIRFLLPFIALVGVLNYFVSRWEPSPHYAGTYREMYAASTEGADTLILGGSNGKFGVNPRPLEACLGKTLNLCLNGCGPLVYQRWYEDVYLRNCPPPKSVLLVLNEYIFDPRLMTRRIEHDSGYFIFRDLIHFAMDPDIELSTLLYNRLALTRRRAVLWHTWFGTPVDEHVDMTQWYHGWAPAEADEPFARSPSQYKVKEDEERVKALRKFIVSLRDRDLRVIVINPPICTPSIALTNSASPQLRALAAELGVAYLDYNNDLASDINRDRSFFMDWEHLNTRGARRWSETLAGDLCRLIERPDHD